jgi:hypothetical protein
MSGARALREMGPSGLCRAALSVCVAVAGLAGGCAPPAAPLPAVAPGVAPQPDAARLSAIENGLARGGRPDSIAAAAMRASGLTPPFERRFVLNPAGGPVVSGLIPGGGPGLRDSLAVAIAISPAAGAALLEAARWITERAVYQHDPARSVMIAIVVTDGALESDAVSAIARTLSAPLWDPAHVSGLVIIGPGAARAAVAARERNVAFTSVEPSAGATTSTIAMDAYAAILEMAAGRARAGVDTTEARP